MSVVKIPEDLEAWAREQVAAGRAASVEKAVEAALRAQRALTDAHRDLVAEAYASVDRGALVSEADADAQLDRWIAEDRAAAR